MNPDVRSHLQVLRLERGDEGVQAIEATTERQDYQHVPGVRGICERHSGRQSGGRQAGECSKSRSALEQRTPTQPLSYWLAVTAKVGINTHGSPDPVVGRIENQRNDLREAPGKRGVVSRQRRIGLLLDELENGLAVVVSKRAEDQAFGQCINEASVGLGQLLGEQFAKVRLFQIRSWPPMRGQGHVDVPTTDGVTRRLPRRRFVGVPVGRSPSHRGVAEIPA